MRYYSGSNNEYEIYEVEKMQDIYKNCPVFETQSFIIRQVKIDDANDLLSCYSDLKSQVLFNADGCTGDFCMYKIDDMKACINAWLNAYEQEEYIRFAIVDKLHDKAIGTIEMFGMVGKYKTDPGVLRIDLSSNYENLPMLKEIVDVCLFNFYVIFGVKNIVTKAIDTALPRIKALTETGFTKTVFKGRNHYYIRSQ